MDPFTLAMLINAIGSIGGGIVEQVSANRQARTLENIAGIRGDAARDRARQIAASRGLTGGAAAGFEEQMRQQGMMNFAPLLMQAQGRQATALPSAIAGGLGTAGSLLVAQQMQGQPQAGGDMDISSMLQMIQALREAGILGGS